MSATGRVGDADPLQAMADAMALGPVDEVLIATHPEGASHWLERDLVSRALRFGLPVAHVVVVLGADRDAGVLEHEPELVV